MELKCDKQEKALVVRIKGSMDAVSAPDFDKHCAGPPGRDILVKEERSCF